MRDFVNLNCVLVLLLCAVSLPISIYPGGLQRLFMSLELALFVVFVVAPSWFLWLVALCARPLWQKRNPFASVPWRRVMATFGLLCLVYGMLKFYIPRRVVFPIHRSVFAGCVARAPESHSGAPLGRRLGMYYVDAFAKDPRGGVYFRTGTTSNWIDIQSWGFAYQPNDLGTPFGNGHYRVHPLVGEWYWFVASNDW